MKNYSNKGMFLESIINNSAEYFKKNNICLIFKRNIPIKIYNVDGNDIKAKLFTKSLSDYYALYKGYFIDFEAKQTEDDVFKMSNLKVHQYEHLKQVNNFGGISFLLIYFVKYDTYIAINFNELSSINNQNIDFNKIVNIGVKVDFKFPGILCFDKYFELLVEKGDKWKQSK